jgi:hypothetical protein
MLLQWNTAQVRYKHIVTNWKVNIPLIVWLTLNQTVDITADNLSELVL